MSLSRVRQIVSEELQKRSVDSGSDHAKLQLDRLAPVMQLAAEAVAVGDVTAIERLISRRSIGSTASDGRRRESGL